MKPVQTRILSSSCVVCKGALETALELPRFPITGIYSAKGQVSNFPDFDQALLVCEKCGHGQLKYLVDPHFLYGSDYGFRTSASATAKAGSLFFNEFVQKLLGGRKVKSILEFGCNDGVLLNLLKPIADKLVGIDPILKGRENEFSDDKIRVIGDTVENVNHEEVFGGAPDLIVSQHTMEHIENPRDVLAGLMKVAGPETLFVLEYPCFDMLLEQHRFDQVFHQHLQYYSMQSTWKLIESVGGEVLDYSVNYTYWGALLVAFKKGQARRSKKIEHNTPNKSVEGIRQRYDLFRSQLNAASRAIELCPTEKLYGFGAALMLPVLAYHLKNDLSGLQGVIDDDPQKEGVGYVNLPVRIRGRAGVDFRESSILLTALDNRRPILKNLVDLKPRQIINPLCFM